MKLTNSIALGSSLYFVLFSAYLELNPKLTNIWYRIDSSGFRSINLESYWHFITRPLVSIDFWYPENWDMNYFLGATITIGLLYWFL
jgi:hypothetical protein